MKVICVARRPMDPTYPHDVLDGEEALLVGVARSDGPPLTEYQWEFGDGTKSERMPVEDPLALEATHIYSGPAERLFRATLVVWDEAGDRGADDYYLRIRPDTLRTRAHIACDRALWSLHKRMNRIESDGVAIGYWESPGKTHRIGITSACIQAFENLGNFPFDDPEESPYVDDVRRALDQLLLDMKPENISPQNAGDPDLNGNGIGLLCHHDQSPQHIFSSEGLAIMALVMSRAPERVATVGGEHVVGRQFVDIVQDMVDFTAFGQTDDNPEEIVARGGWRYDLPNSGEADMACTEWPVSGLMMAGKNWGKFGLRVPAWVKAELRENFLVADHNAETGGWQYMADPTGRVNIGLTGIGILCSAWTGLPLSDPMVQSGLAYIAANWDSGGQFGHLTSLFSMYAIANAMRAYECDAIGPHDWYREYAEHLIHTQNPDGSWSSEGYEKSWPLATAWAVLVLLKPQTPPTVIMDHPERAQQGDVSLTYRLFDDNYDECDLVLEFSSDGGQTWPPATQVGGDDLTHVEAVPEGLARLFIWDTLTDIGKANVDNVSVRLTAYDGEKGEADEIILPGVYNDVVPFERVEIAAPSANGRGVAAADFDDDGDLDVFVANFDEEDFLLRNDSGVLVETSPLGAMGGALPSTCGVWGDFNGDGAIDLYLVLAGKPNKLYAGDGAGSFAEVASQVSVANAGGGTSAAWGDYDSDNRLDLYVGNDPSFGSGLKNALYRNWGIPGFADLAGPKEMNCSLATRSIAWCDFDRDGKIDLYVANGSLPSEEQGNRLFHNLSAELLLPFPDVSSEAGVSDPRSAAAVVWADFNSDALFDIYLVNSGSDENVLYLNNGDGTFRDETAHAGLRGPPNARGAAVADCDNDGDLDIFVSVDGEDCLYINRGDCTFADVARLAGISEIADSRGAAWLDVNGDGFLDLYVSHNGAKDVIYLNRATEGNWLRVRCLTDANGDATDTDYADDRDAIGAIVEVDLDGDMDFSPEPPDRLEMQCVDGGSGYMSQGQLWPHFGLGRYAIADVKVTFPDGSIVYKCGVSANQTEVIRDIAPTGDFYVHVFTPEAPRSGRVAIGYMIFNSAEKHCDIGVEYSPDSGQTWEPAVMSPGGEGISGLLSSPEGVLHTFLWDSIMNLGISNHDSVRMRITPLGPDRGQPGETTDFSVHNNTAPQVFVETPSGVSTGEIPIRYTLADAQSDNCTIRVEYSTGPGNPWRMATVGSGGDGTITLGSSPEGVLHTYVWNSFAGIGSSVLDSVRIRITPSDRWNGGEAKATDFFFVDNNLPPSASVDTPLSVQKGAVVLTYRLLDAEGDPCSVGVFYSLDGGRSWLSATMAAGGDGTTGLKSAPSGEPHTYAWNSLEDFGRDYSAVVRMMVIPHDAKTGASGQTTDFVVDNLRPAEMAFSPTFFSFSSEEGGEPPAPQTLEIWNIGSHSLEWIAATDAGWLMLYPAAGSSSGEKDAVEVSVDTTALSEGTYEGNITVSAPDAVGSPVKIPVVLEIFPPPPSLSVPEFLLAFRAEEGGAD
ncbi:VCBS repeat-containing protein, partial [bacterium]|nr:VCBS repeat-containing protein [bacterium]